MKKPFDSGGSTHGANGARTRAERTYDRILDSASTTAMTRALLGHLRACLRGRLPDCATCLDEKAINAGRGGYVRCPDCT